MAFALRYRSFLTASSLVLAACGAEEQSQQEEPSFEIEPSVAQAALENPLLVCRQKGFECTSKATDAAGFDACRTQTATCLDDAAKQGQAAAQALQKCQSDARSCVTGGGSIGDCRKQYDVCTQAVVPPAADAGAPSGGGLPSLPGGGGLNLPEAGLPTLPGGGGLPSLPGGGGLNLPEAGLPTLPGGGGLPSLPGGGGLNLPEAGLPTLPGGGGLPGLPGGGNGPSLPGSGGGPLSGGVKCLQDMQACVAKDPSQAMTCADTARACIAGTP